MIATTIEQGPSSLVVNADIRDHSHGSTQHVEIGRINRAWSWLAGFGRQRRNERPTDIFARKEA
jgi:hypothetical protein